MKLCRSILFTFSLIALSCFFVACEDDPVLESPSNRGAGGSYGSAGGSYGKIFIDPQGQESGKKDDEIDNPEVF